MNRRGHPPKPKPRTFSEWFLEQEMRASAAMGIAADRAALRLFRAVAFLEQGLYREALDEANAAAYLDPERRAEALLVARMCVRRELERELEDAGFGGDPTR
jgi:hypothetical protein